MRIGIGLGITVERRFSNPMDYRRIVLGLRLVFDIVRGSRNRFRDRPYVTGTPVSRRTDSPFQAGQRRDRLGK